MIIASAIDIHEIAACRLTVAQRWYVATGTMNASPHATVAYEDAMTDLELAMRDMDRVRNLIKELDQ